MKKSFQYIGVLFALGCYPSGAEAGTATTNFPVTATVLSVCAVSALPLAFGNYDPTSTSDLDASTTLSVLCTLGTSFTVGLSAGTASAATVSSRAMTNSGSTLSYALYQNAGRTTNWGNTAGVDTPAAVVAGLTPTSLTVYGRVTKNQNVSPGLYQDTITVTVNY